MINGIREFLRLEAVSGLFLMVVTALALLIANSSWVSAYSDFFSTPFTMQYGALVFHKPLLFLINDGLMVIFFFLIGLEIKREFLIGSLSHASHRVLPGIATLGGVLFPAIIYVILNYQDPINLRGWAIPTATDIAFALGVLSLVGKKIPQPLKIFLMTIAVLDDLVAVLIIAIFYAHAISLVSLLLAFLALLLLTLFNYKKIKYISPYLIISLLLWFFVLHSGVHATVAGVFAAFTIPLHTAKESEKSPLMVIEQALTPWVAYVILPIFAFANAGVSFAGLTFSTLLQPLPLGILLGLFMGKQIGIFLGTWLPVKLKWAKLPASVSWAQIYGISVLCGIGFTMSLFISTLAFENGGPAYDRLVRLGVLTASLLSSLFGYLILACFSMKSMKSTKSARTQLSR